MYSYGLSELALFNTPTQGDLFYRPIALTMASLGPVEAYYSQSYIPVSQFSHREIIARHSVYKTVTAGQTVHSGKTTVTIVEENKEAQVFWRRTMRITNTITFN